MKTPCYIKGALEKFGNARKERKRMYIEITTGMEINERAIIKEYALDNNSNGIEIRMAVDDYVAGLDDSDYFIMTQEDAQEQVVDKIKELLGVESEEEVNG